jgi:hypothetical protein
MSNRLYSDNCNSKIPLEYKYGFWYEDPHSLSMQDWADWETNVKKKHPIQYLVREFASDSRYTLLRWYRTTKYKIRSIFKPFHQDIRNVVPREWADINDLIVSVNFAMIKSFKKEADESHVDWDGTEKHREFKNWLDSAAHWIMIGKPKCQAQADALHPPHPFDDLQKGKTYEELYGEMNKMEKLMEDTDSKILREMIEYRGYFWT